MRNTSIGGTNEHYKRTTFFKNWKCVIPVVCVKTGKGM